MKLSFAVGGTFLDEACWGSGPPCAIGLWMGRITSAVALYPPSYMRVGMGQEKIDLTVQCGFDGELVRCCL